MTKTEKAVTWAIEIANDPAHGYDQDNRWGPDYDCSSLVISAWQQAGVPVKTKGAYNTKSMKSVFLSCGFKDVTSSVNLDNGSGMKRGDVLLNIARHTVMHIGNGKVVSASINENGGAHGGTPGDQNGNEIKSRITTTARGIVFFVIMKILHLRIQNHSQLLEMPKSAKVRVMPINLPILASPLPGKEMLPLRKQLLKFFRQL
mgnify:CR=1 FL=1